MLPTPPASAAGSEREWTEERHDASAPDGVAERGDGVSTRVRAVLLVTGTVALGLLSRRVHLGVGLWDKSLGDVLYTVMVYGIVLALAPRLRPATLGVIAIGVSFAVELFQLTGIPARLPRLAQLALGTTFAWHDLACYVVGGGVVAVGHAALRR